MDAEFGRLLDADEVMERGDLAVDVEDGNVMLIQGLAGLTAGRFTNSNVTVYRKVYRPAKDQVKWRGVREGVIKFLQEGIQRLNKNYSLLPGGEKVLEGDLVLMGSGKWEEEIGRAHV